MPTDPDDTDRDDLLAELRELCDDVTGDHEVRARRLAVLRRLESQRGHGDRPSALAA